MSERFKALDELEGFDRFTAERKLCSEIEEEAENLYKNGNLDASLGLYDLIVDNASTGYVLDNTQAIKRAVEILNGDVEKHIAEKNVSDETLRNAERAADLMALFGQKFEPDENGEFYIELADDQFQKEHKMKAYEQLGRVYHELELMDNADFMRGVYYDSVNPDFIYTTGLFFERLVENDDDLMNEYGSIIVDAYENYLMAADPFDPDYDRLKHAHGILDYYYGFGYGVERNLAKSMLHENANKNINKHLGRQKAKQMSDLLASIQGFNK